MYCSKTLSLIRDKVSNTVKCLSLYKSLFSAVVYIILPKLQLIDFIGFVSFLCASIFRDVWSVLSTDSLNIIYFNCICYICQTVTQTYVYVFFLYLEMNDDRMIIIKNIVTNRKKNTNSYNLSKIKFGGVKITKYSFGMPESILAFLFLIPHTVGTNGEITIFHYNYNGDLAK